MGKRRNRAAGKLSQRNILGQDKKVKALEMRKAGHTFQQIADALGYAHPQSAHHAVKTALEETIQEPADDLRRLESERLDAMFQAIWPWVLKGDLKSIDRAVKLMDRRAKLLGLDTPIQLSPDSSPEDFAIDLSSDPDQSQ